MTINDLIFDLECHREIEFHIKDKKYFLQPVFESDTPDLYLLYDCTNNESKLLFKGSIQSLLTLKIDGKYSLEENFDCFYIDFVL